MKISLKEWNNYTKKLQRLNERAAIEFRAYIEKYGYDDRAVNFAFALATKYGNGVGTLAAEMYDRIAELQGARVPAAEISKTATRAETSAAVKATDSVEQQVNGVKSLVKQVSSYTMLKNAQRDGAEFAWIAVGDTCPFCLMLASNGWKKAGKKTRGGTHAVHIHANCDCEYAIRFKPLDVEGYDPDTIYDKLDSYEGSDWDDKINAMRRERYAENKDEINKRKRELYAAQKDKK